MNKNNKKVTGAFLGTIVEYYDYSLYGFSAVILGEKFFPAADRISSLMYAYAIYALSYIAKPIGSIFFSRMGDKYGRRTSLKITIFGIAIPTLIIGILPSYDNLGVLATEILILCRFFQGFFAAGEYDGAAIYVIEHLGKKYHYTASAITRTTGVIGLLLGIAVTNFFNSPIFPDWCWRIPFILSLPLALVTIYYRQSLQETPIFENSKKNYIEFLNIYKFFKKNWLLLIYVIFLAGGFGVTYQVSVILMKQYLPLIAPRSVNIITSYSILVVIAFGISMPISGYLADKFGYKNILKISLIFSTIACILFMIAAKNDYLNLILVATLILALSVAPFNALAHGVIINAFQANERYRGIGLGHTTGSLLMSGTANYICLYFMHKYDLMLFPIIYVLIFAFVAYFSAIRIVKYVSKNTI